MHVTVDVHQVRACLDLWRHALSLTRAEPASDLRAIEDRVRTTIAATVTGWLDLLRLCSADGPDSLVLADITNEIRQFQAWANQAHTTAA